MAEKNYDILKLDNQICFPLYACGKEITRLYKPLLDSLDLTYTQYVSMMVLWECREIKLKDLGKRLFLDSGTLTPLLRKLEAKGYIDRCQDPEDDRNLIIKVTDKGLSIRDKALEIPSEIASCTNLTKEEAITLYNLLHKVMHTFEK